MPSAAQIASKEAGTINLECSTLERRETEAPVDVAEITVTPRANSPILRGWRLYAVQGALSFGLFLGGLDSSIVATALVTISKDFNTFVRVQWIVLAYLLTYLGFALLFSRLSDVIGRKYTSIAALVILTARSLACGLSKTLDQLIAFRALQGIGGSGVYAMSLTASPEITPPDKFKLIGALTGVTVICSSVLGPILGGVITSHASWRWIFLFNVPCGIFAIALTLVAWPTTRTAGMISWRRLDVIGGLLYGGASVLLVFALQQAGAGAYAWSSPVIIACLVIAAAAAILFCVWIWYLSSGDRPFAPLFPARVVQHRIIAANIVISTLAGYLLFANIFALPQRFQIVNGKSSQGAGIDLLPLLISSAVGAFIAITPSTGDRNWLFHTMTVASILVVLGCGLLSSVGDRTNIPKYLYGYEVVLGIGAGMLIVCPIIGIRLNALEEDAASAQGLASQSRILGGNIGLALATIILDTHLETDLAGVLTPAQINALRESLNTIETFTPAQVAAVAASFAKAFRSQLQACLGVAAVTLIVALSSWQKHPPTMAGQQRAMEDAEQARIRGEVPEMRAIQ